MIVSFDSLNQYERPIFHLCNPGCQLTDGVLTNAIGILSDTSDEEIVFEFNATSTLSLRAYNRGDKDDSDNDAYLRTIFNSIQNSRMIYVDDIGFFVITSADYSFDDGVEYKDVEASSCDIELQNKCIPYIEDGTYQFKELLTKVLSASPMWTIDHIDDTLQSTANSSASGADTAYYTAKFEAERLEYLIQIYTRVLNNIENASDYSASIAEYGGDALPSTEDVSALTSFVEGKITSTNKLLEAQKAILSEYQVETPVLSDSKAYRTFEDVDTNSNVLNFILEDMQDAYECIILFDIKNRTVSAYDQDNYIKETSIHLTRDDLIQSLQITENMDDMYTAISCTGDDEDVNIASINPLGTNTIYRFDYYLDWMTSGLSAKVKAWQDKIAYYGNDDGETPETDDYSKLGASYANALTKYTNYNSEVSRLETLISKYQLCYDNIVVSVDLAKQYDSVISEYGGDIASKILYAVTDSESTKPTEYSETMPTYEEGDFLWVKITATDSEGGTSTFEGHTEITDTNEVNAADALALQIFVKSKMATCTSDKSTAESNASAAQEEANSYLTKMNAINNELDFENYFTEEEYNELSSYIMEGQYSDEYITITDSMTTDEKYAQYKQLYRRAKKEVQAISEPTQEFSLDVENFIFAQEFSHFTNELETGVLINVELSEDDVAELLLTEITINYDDTSLSMTFGNRLNRYDPKALFNDVLGDVQRSANSVEYLNTIVYPIKQGAITTIKKELSESRNLTKEAVLASTNQSITIDDTGYTGKKIVDDETDPKQIKIANNSIVFTEDAWDTASVAIGELKLSEDKSVYGINAKYIYGDIVTNATTNIVITDGEGKVQYDLSDLPVDLAANKDAASTADEKATAAGTEATAAKTLAAGKNRVYYSPTVPKGTFVDGDVWFDTSTGSVNSAGLEIVGGDSNQLEMGQDDEKNDGAIAHQMWIYSSSEEGWVLHQFGTYSIAEGAIVGDRIAANTITADNLAAGAITTGIITVTGSEGKVNLDDQLATYGTVESYVTYYAKNTSTSTPPTGYTSYPPTGSWTTDVQTWEDGKYIWAVTYTVHKDGSADIGTPANITGAKGSTGSAGNGISSIAYYYLASNSSSAPTAASITETNMNKQIITAEKKYLWQKEVITFTDKTTKTTVILLAVYGDTGDNGSDGYNTVTVYLFKRSSSTPSVPSEELTYTFSSKTLTGDTSGWTQAVPAQDTDKNPCYATLAKVASVNDTDTIAASEWSPPVIVYTDGINGIDGSTIWTTTVAPTTPNYTFTISDLSGTTGSTPKINDVILYSYYKYTISSVGTTTVVGSNQVILKGDQGDEGVGIASVTELYYCSSSSTAPSAPTTLPITTSSSSGYNKWNLTCPTYSASYPYYYTCQQILYTTGSYGCSGVTVNNGYKNANANASNALSAALSSGRNYIIHSGDRSVWYLNTKGSYISVDRNITTVGDEYGSLKCTTATETGASYAYKMLYNNSNNYIATPETVLTGGKQYTFSLYVKIGPTEEDASTGVTKTTWQPAGGKTSSADEHFWFRWIDDNNTGLASLRAYFDASADYSDWTRISATATISSVAATNIQIRFVAPKGCNFLKTAGNVVYYKDFKLETGSSATEWSAAVEDMYYTNTTKIDGGNIYTGSITADQIKADSITANKIKLGGMMSVYDIADDGSYGNAGGSLGYKSGTNWGGYSTDGIAIKSAANSKGEYGYVIATTDGARMTQYDGTDSYSIYIADGVGHCDCTFAAPYINLNRDSDSNTSTTDNAILTNVGSDITYQNCTTKTFDIVTAPYVYTFSDNDFTTNFKKGVEKDSSGNLLTNTKSLACIADCNMFTVFFRGKYDADDYGSEYPYMHQSQTFCCDEDSVWSYLYMIGYDYWDSGTHILFRKIAISKTNHSITFDPGYYYGTNNKDVYPGHYCFPEKIIMWKSGSTNYSTS